MRCGCRAGRICVGWEWGLWDRSKRYGTRVSAEALTLVDTLTLVDKGIDAVSLREAGKTRRQIDNLERGAARLSSTLPGE